jgi:phage-related holin
MSFLFGAVDFLLTVILTLDTLSLLNQLRKTNKCDKNDYKRVCFTWIFFLLLKSLTCCSCKKGFLSTMCQFLGLLAKAFIVIPLLNGTNMIYDYCIEKGKVQEMAKKGIDFVKSKISGAAPSAASSSSSRRKGD